MTHRIRAAALLLAAATVITTITAHTSASGLQTTSGKVLFADNFTGRAGAPPNQAHWTDYSACTYNGSAAFGQIGCGDTETLDGSGHLAIPASPTTGSAIRVARRYAHQYGVFSAWIKAPAQVGYWPAFWTLNNNYSGNNIPTLGEADVYEGYTKWPTLFHANAHNWSNTSAPSSSSPDSVCGGPDLSAAFHKYSVRIAPGTVTFYFDDTQCGQAFTPATNPGKPYGFGPNVTVGNWIILDLAVGGAGGQQPTPTSSAVMLVDRVEIRAL